MHIYLVDWIPRTDRWMFSKDSMAYAWIGTVIVGMSHSDNSIYTG